MSGRSSPEMKTAGSSDEFSQSPYTALPASLIPATTQVPALQFVGKGGASGYLYSPDYKEFQPRFGFAWKPDFFGLNNGSKPLLIRGGFGGDDALRAETLKYVEGLDILNHPKKLAEVAKAGVDDYVGLFIPGRHAPVQDLSKDKNLGEILKAFHSAGKTTGILCHCPLVLLSTLSDSEAFQNALADKTGVANSLAKDWPYAGYRLTVFSTGEEQYLENAGALGGFVRYYPTAALAEAGAHVDTVADWHSNVIVDRELITGQQPMSATEFGDVLIKKLSHK